VDPRCASRVVGGEVSSTTSTPLKERFSRAPFISSPRRRCRLVGFDKALDEEDVAFCQGKNTDVEREPGDVGATSRYSLPFFSASRVGRLSRCRVLSFRGKRDMRLELSGPTQRKARAGSADGGAGRRGGCSPWARRSVVVVWSGKRADRGTQSGTSRKVIIRVQNNARRTDWGETQEGGEPDGGTSGSAWPSRPTIAVASSRKRQDGRWRVEYVIGSMRG